jgi:hypothetical protein
MSVLSSKTDQQKIEKAEKHKKWQQFLTTLKQQWTMCLGAFPNGLVRQSAKIFYPASSTIKI